LKGGARIFLVTAFKREKVKNF